MADDTHTELTVGVKLLSSLRVIDLKTELEKRGLSKSGSKRELLERLKRQLQLENLHQKSSQNEDHVPNLSLQDDALVSQNEVVKQYLAGQQKIYELQKEARRKIEQDDAYRASDTEASSSQDEGPSTRDAERNREEGKPDSRILPTLTQSKIVSDDDKTQDQTELELGASGLVADGLPEVVADQTASLGENLSKALLLTEPEATGDPPSILPKESPKVEAQPGAAGQEVKDELALAVGSICGDRDVPLDLSEHTTVRVEQFPSPVFVDRAELDRAALEAMEAAAVLENEIASQPVLMAEAVAVPEDATVSSSSSGLNLDGSLKGLASLGQESSEGVDETAEACRIISQSFIHEESQPEKNSPEPESLADVSSHPPEEESMGRIRRSQTKGQSESPAAAAVESPKSKRKYALRGEKQATPEEKEDVPEIPLPPQDAPTEPDGPGTAEKGARSSSGDDGERPEKASQHRNTVKRENSISPEGKPSQDTTENLVGSELPPGTIKREIPSPSCIQRRSPHSPEENCSVNLVKSEAPVVPEHVPLEPTLKVESLPEEASSRVKEDAEVEPPVSQAESVIKFEGPALPASIERANHSRSRSGSRSKEESRKSRSPSPSKSRSRSSKKGRSRSPSPSRKKSRSALKASKSPSPKATRRPRLKRGKKPDSRSPSPSKRKDRSAKRGKSKSASPAGRRRDRSARKKKASRSPSPPHRHREKSPKRRKSVSRTPSPSAKRRDKSPRHKTSKSRSRSPSSRKGSKQRASRSKSPSPPKTQAETTDTTEGKSRSSSPEKAKDAAVLYSILEAKDRTEVKSRSSSPEKAKDAAVLYSILEANDSTEVETKTALSEGLSSQVGEQANEKSEGEKGHVPERKRRDSSQKENVNPSETSSALTEVTESGEALKESGHILDLHPCEDMDIGDNPLRTTDRTSNEVEPKSHKKSSSSSDQQQRSHHPRNLSNRKLSLSGSRDSKDAAANQEEEGGRPARKRRWGALVKPSKSTPSISTECLKDLIPDYKPHLSALSLSPEDLKEAPLSPSAVHPTGEESSPSDKKPQEENEGVRAETSSRGVPLERRRTTSTSAAGPFGPQPAVAPPSPHKGGGVEADSRAAPEGGRSLSPAKNPASGILFIRNLVRPFTLPQLKDMLGRTGALVPDAFWIDKIKSKCYVMYESQEEAVMTRSALHGSRWPISNPKTLLVDFSTEEELNFHKQLGDSPGLPPPPPVAQSGHRLDPQQPPSQQQQHRGDEHFPNSHRLAKNMTVVVSQDVSQSMAFPAAIGRLATSRHHRDELERGRGNLGNPAGSSTRGGRLLPAPPVREWDRDKLSQEVAPHAHRHRHHKEPPGSKGGGEGDPGRPSAGGGPPSDRDRKERSSRREKKGEGSKKKVEEPPGKLLDDLFKKTKAIPCIYWLPLTDAALALREVEKKQWELEREKRREKRQETGGPEGGSSGERPRPRQREALKPLPPPTLTGGNVAPLKGRVSL